jgi:hypothetical protein
VRKWVIISGIVFTIGNATWNYIGLEKVFWLPLGIFLWVMVVYIANNPKNASHPMKTGLYYLAALATGNIIKQAFYQDGMFQYNDYVWGICVTIFYLLVLFKDWLLYNLKNLWEWVTQNKRFGKK